MVSRELRFSWEPGAPHWSSSHHSTNRRKFDTVKVQVVSASVDRFFPPPFSHFFTFSLLYLLHCSATPPGPITRDLNGDSTPSFSALVESPLLLCFAFGCFTGGPTGVRLPITIMTSLMLQRVSQSFLFLILANKSLHSDHRAACRGSQ